MDRYHRIHSKIWQDKKFIALPDKARLLFLYLLTSPHANTIGAYVLPLSYIAQDLNWTIKEVSSNLALIVANLPITYDKPRSLLYIKNYLIYHPLQNPNQITFAQKTLKALPNSQLLNRLKFKLLGKQFPNRSPNGCPNGSPNGSGTVRLNPTPTLITNNITPPTPPQSRGDKKLASLEGLGFKAKRVGTLVELEPRLLALGITDLQADLTQYPIGRVETEILKMESKAKRDEKFKDPAGYLVSKLKD